MEFATLWLKPYWDLVEYQVSLRYVDGCGGEPVWIQKEGTLHVGPDTGPDQILLALARHLEDEAARPDLQRNVPSP